MKNLKIFALLLTLALLLGAPMRTLAQTGCMEGNCTNGYGMYIYSNGDKYVGNFSGGFKSGYGVYTWSNGEFYVGNWGNDKQSGKGTCVYKSGQRYEGNYVAGLREGYGSYYWPNGDRYEGDFKYNKMNGQGVYYFANGNVNRGKFVDDKFVGTSSSSGDYSNNNNSGDYFCTEFNKVKNEMRYEFSGIKGNSQRDELGEFWRPTVLLPGAKDGEISDPLGFGMSCSYGYIYNGNYSDANDVFQDLKLKLKKCKPGGWYEAEEGGNQYDPKLVKKFQIEDQESKDGYGLKGHRIYIYWTNTDGKHKVVLWFVTNK